MIDKILQFIFLAQDKANHFVYATLVFSAVHFYSVHAALAAVAVMAVGKEVYDFIHRDRHTPDIWDAVATCAGGVVGFICTL